MSCSFPLFLSLQRVLSIQFFKRSKQTTSTGLHVLNNVTLCVKRGANKTFSRMSLKWTSCLCDHSQIIHNVNDLHKRNHFSLEKGLAKWWNQAHKITENTQRQPNATKPIVRTNLIAPKWSKSSFWSFKVSELPPHHECDLSLVT